jgi:hypothetical protein
MMGVSLLEAISLVAGVAIAIAIIAGPAKPYYKRPKAER